MKEAPPPTWEWGPPTDTTPRLPCLPGGDPSQEEAPALAKWVHGNGWGGQGQSGRDYQAGVAVRQRDMWLSVNSPAYHQDRESGKP